MRTLSGPVSVETVVRHSRFLTQASRVDSEDQAEAFLSRVSDPEATHNCWAWRLDGRYRFSDDGEPGGTAGRPILAVIEGRELDHVMVVVTRWFGGVKLGAGGLVRAYSGAAARCLDQGEVVLEHPERDVRIEADFEWIGAVHTAITACAARRREEAFTPRGVHLTVAVRADRLDELETLLRDGTRGTARLQVD